MLRNSPISFQIAKRLKESMNFDWLDDVFFYYEIIKDNTYTIPDWKKANFKEVDQGEGWVLLVGIDSLVDPNAYPAPTEFLLARWLSEKGYVTTVQSMF